MILHPTLPILSLFSVGPGIVAENCEQRLQFPFLPLGGAGGSLRAEAGTGNSSLRPAPGGPAPGQGCNRCRFHPQRLQLLGANADLPAPQRAGHSGPAEEGAGQAEFYTRTSLRTLGQHPRTRQANGAHQGWSASAPPKTRE